MYSEGKHLSCRDSDQEQCLQIIYLLKQLEKRNSLAAEQLSETEGIKTFYLAANPLAFM